MVGPLGIEPRTSRFGLEGRSCPYISTGRFPTDTVFAFKLLLDKSRALPIELEPHINYMYRVCSRLTSFNHERFNHTHPRLDFTSLTLGLPVYPVELDLKVFQIYGLYSLHGF